MVGLAASLAHAGGVFQPQPGVQPANPPEKPIVIDLRDEVGLPQLIDFVRRVEGIQVIYAEDLSDKKVYFPAPITIPASRLVNFLIQVLEQKGFTLVHNDIINVYNIVPLGNQLTPVVGGNFASTQIVDTKGIKPSALQGFVNIIGGFTNAVYADDLGVMVVTDSPNKIDLLRTYIDKLIAVRDEVQFVALEVRNISATAARDRILALVGESSGTPNTPFGNPNVPQPGKQATPTPNPGTGSAIFTSVTSNLSFQLLVDPQSNSLFFRGRPEELEYVSRLLELVDVTNKMRSIFYEVGVRAAEVIAFQGSREGLGDVTTYQSTSEDGSGIAGLGQPRPGVQQPQPQIPGQQGNQNQASNAAGFVIYPEAGGFMYHGTPEQHARISVLAKDLEKLSQGDLMTMEFYKLKHAKAEDVVGILGSLLGDDGSSGNTGSILGNDLSRGNQNQNRRSSRNSSRSGQTDPLNRNERNTDRNSTSGGLSAVGNEETSIIQDDKNNQVIVKTRQRLQPEFAKLIQRLDARRPQVYVNAQIVAVTDSENSRLAVETQILAGQFGLNTNFGLGSFPTGGDFFSGKNVATGLPAFTAAVVRSDFVPFIITALQNNTDSRILATPQLLVDDNESATVLSENEVPTQVTQSPDSGGVITSVGEPARAGTTLEVTPQISENAVKLDIFVEQSAFTGEATATLPPPTQRNQLSSLVTVPRDCTIVIGGLTLDSDTKTVVKVPILGDIPLAGLLFRDTVKRKTRTTLYVFLTPTIMTDPTFADLRLLTKGPAADVKLESDHILPAPSLVPMEIGRPLVPTPPIPEPDERLPEPAPAVPPPAPASPAVIGRPSESTAPVEKRIQP